jgi:hypothetical protein
VSLVGCLYEMMSQCDLTLILRLTVGASIASENTFAISQDQKRLAVAQARASWNFTIHTGNPNI